MYIIKKFRDSSFSQLEIKVGGGQFCISLPTQKQGPKIPPRSELKCKCKKITNKKVTLCLLSFIHAFSADLIFKTLFKCAILSNKSYYCTDKHIVLIFLTHLSHHLPMHSQRIFFSSPSNGYWDTHQIHFICLMVNIFHNLEIINTLCSSFFGTNDIKVIF